MIDWKRYVTKRNLILAIPWVYLVIYSFVIRGMAEVYRRVMDGNTVIDPVYTNSQLTIMVSFWVLFAIIVIGYFLVRYACRSAAKATLYDKIKELESENRALRSDLENSEENIRSLRKSVLDLTGRVFALEKSPDNATETGIETN